MKYNNDFKINFMPWIVVITERSEGNTTRH